MKEGYSKIMQNFNLKNIPDLDICVLGALELFNKNKIPRIKISYKHPLVVGSGNAEATGKIIFRDIDAVFANESNFKEKLRRIKSIDGVIIVSSSGGKHAPIIAKYSKKHKKSITLITNKKNSPTEKLFLNKTLFKSIVFPKQREPYTYNTSTYMGMILGKTKENPKKLYNFIINKTSKLKLPNFKKYNKIYIIIPSNLSEMKRMIQVKFIELFGRQIARDVETIEYIKHATTVVPSKELFISFGEENKQFGKERLFIPLPKNADYVALMSISYYIIGKIQKQNKAFFKENIVSYTKKISKIFKEEIKPIVE